MTKLYYQIGATAPTAMKSWGQFDYRAKAQKEMREAKSPFAVFWSDLNAEETAFYPFDTLDSANKWFDAIQEDPHNAKWNEVGKRPVVYAVLLDRKNPLDGSNEDLKPLTDESRYVRAEGYWVAENEVTHTVSKTVTTMSPAKKVGVGLGIGFGLLALFQMAKH